MSTPTPFRHEIRVRYGEVDMQRHVFNAHYLAYVDDACDAWLRSALGDDYLTSGALDIVLKRADITWHGDRAAHFVNTMMSQGAALVDGTGVVRMRAKE